MKSLFEDVFDGPDSLFGKVFGEDVRKADKTTKIRVTLSDSLIFDLVSGKNLSFYASPNIEITVEKEK